MAFGWVGGISLRVYSNPCASSTPRPAPSFSLALSVRGVLDRALSFWGTSLALQGRALALTSRSCVLGFWRVFPKVRNQVICKVYRVGLKAGVAS